MHKMTLSLEREPIFPKTFQTSSPIASNMLQNGALARAPALFSKIHKWGRGLGGGGGGP